jgi:hypothetical protein
VREEDGFAADAKVFKDDLNIIGWKKVSRGFNEAILNSNITITSSSKLLTKFLVACRASIVFQTIVIQTGKAKVMVAAQVSSRRFGVVMAKVTNDSWIMFFIVVISNHVEVVGGR